MPIELRLLFYYLLLQARMHGFLQASLLAKITTNHSFTLRNLAYPGARPHESPAALTLLWAGDTKNASLLMTYPPDEWERGLIWSRFVTVVFYLNDGKVYRIEREMNPVKSAWGPAILVEELGPVPPDPETWFVREFEKDAKRKKFCETVLVSFRQQISTLTPRRQDPLESTTLPFLDGIPVISQDCNSMILRDGMFMKLALALVGAAWCQNKASPLNLRGGALVDGNNIGAVLVDQHSRILGWSVNVASIDSTCHAECGLIRTILNRKGSVPESCRLYTSLEPCHMCAGLLARHTRNWMVIYGQKDASIENNALERKVGSSRQRQLLDSSARQVEQAWSDFVAPALRDATRSGRPPVLPNTLDFLRAPRAHDAFLRLRLVPQQIEATLFRARAPRQVPLRATSRDVVGRLGLELPGGILANRPSPNYPRASRAEVIGRLNLDTSLARSPVEPLYRTGGFGQELALAMQCVTLMANLLNRGLITFAD